MSLEQASFDVQRRTTVTRGAIARRRRFVRTVTGRGLILIVVTLGALIILAPVLWMLSTSVKTLPQVLVFPPSGFPRRCTGRTTAPR